MTFTTSDGVINEVFPTTLIAMNRHLAQFEHPFDAAATQRIGRSQSGAAPAKVQMVASFTAYGDAGTLSRDGGSIAMWPYKPDCEGGDVPITAPDVHPSASDLIPLLNGQGNVTRPAGGTVPLTFTAARAVERSACYRLAAVDDFGLEALADLQVSIAGGPPVTLRAEVQAALKEDGSLASVGFWTVDRCATPGLLPADFISQCGDWGLDVTGYDRVFMKTGGGFSPTLGLTGDVVISGCHGDVCSPLGDGLYGILFGLAPP